MERNKKIIFTVLGLALVVLLVFTSFYTIKSTQRGILSTFGKIHPEPVDDGLHIKIPFIQTVRKVNIQQKKHDGEESAYTRDVQTAMVRYTINYDIVKHNVSNLYANIGGDYHERIVVPYIRSAMKEAFGNFAATEIVENRDEIRVEIEKLIRKAVDSNYFYNIQFQLTNIDFDDEFELAIREKQVAEQNALKAKNVTVQVEEQAKQTKIKAEADAEAIRIKANALERNPKLVEYEAVQKWNGELPTYMMGDAVPFLNLK